MQYQVSFTFDDGYGGLYDLSATVDIDGPNATVTYMDGLTDQDGGELPRLQAEADEAAIEAAYLIRNGRVTGSIQGQRLVDKTIRALEAQSSRPLPDDAAQRIHDYLKAKGEFE